MIQTKQERSEHYNQMCITCDCIACKDDWPLLEQMNDYKVMEFVVIFGCSCSVVIFTEILLCRNKQNRALRDKKLKAL